jgi:uncharacterized Zn finger protein
MERETECKVVTVELECDECGGTLVFTGTALLSSPPQFPHKCDKCGVVRNVLDRPYPHTRVVPTGGSE